MTDYTCQLCVPDSGTLKFKPSDKPKYESGIHSISPSKQRNFTILLCNRLFKGEMIGGNRFGIKLIYGNRITIKLMKGFPNGNGVPAIHVIFHQITCYENLQETYGEIVRWIVMNFGIGQFWWGNIDLCVHVEGYDFDLVEDHDRLRGLYYQKNGFLMAQEDNKTIFTGFQVGSPKSERVAARIYDKLEKVKRGRSNNKFYLDPRPYYRYQSLCKRPWVVEFSFRHKFLKDYGIINGNDLWGKLPDLWRYGTQKYLIHTASKEDKKTPSEFWKWVSGLWGDGVELRKNAPVIQQEEIHKTIKKFRSIRSEVTTLLEKLPAHQQDVYSQELVKHIIEVNKQRN